jgi:hypothetical protein
MSPFSISAYAAGVSNLAIMRGSPSNANANANADANANTESNNNMTPMEAYMSPAAPPAAEPWDAASNSLQILYPNGSINPGNKPQGGTEFYAHPLDVKGAMNVTLEYSVFFPKDFDFVKGGKLPGLYGGHKGCSGGNAAEE